MSGCETTSLKYPDGSDLMSYEGCPVETIVYFCTNSEWMATQNTCTDEMLPQCLLDAFPGLAELTGGYSPHRTVASSEGDCSPDQVQGGDCEDQGESSGSDCGSGSSADCSGGECCGGDCSGGDCACENCDCECCEKEDEGPAPCTAQMGECTGGPDKDCATMFTSTLYYN